MTTVELIATTAAAGVVLIADGESLRVQAPAGAVTPEIRALLRAHKPELLAVLWRLDGMRIHTDPVPTARSSSEAPGGPGRCFSCGDGLDHPQAYGRCVPCWIAVEIHYRTRGDE